MADKVKILHVEDNFENRILVRRILQSNGFEVIEAENAFEALEALSHFTPNLILMDINMPEVDGYTLTQQIKSNQSFITVPIIAVTANVMKGDREKTINAGCEGYIEKPIDVDTFIDQIESYLR